MLIDVSKTPLENLIAQVIADNAGLQLTTADVTAGAPSVFAGDPQNTQVTLTAVVGQGWTGSKVFKYTRLGLDSGVAVPVTTVTVVGADDQAGVETKVATALGLRKDQLTFSAYSAAADGVPGSITLAIVADSLLYVGANKTVALELATQDLGTIPNDQLTGFTPAS